MSALVVLLSVVIPTFLAVVASWLWRRWQDRTGRRSPLENRAVYGAGEQLRVRVDEHTDSMMGGLVALFWLGPYFLAVWSLPKVMWSSVSFTAGDALLIVAFVVMVGFAIRHVVKHGVLRRRAKEGLKAELFAAQELNRLLASGCAVLHDIPADGFNVDHVVIGPRAVYAIETKSVRKPSQAEGATHKVRYDGTALHFPHFVSAKPIQQARRQAEWLRTYLQTTLKMPVPVVAAVALPGWWIDSEKSASNDSVRVFNPAGKGGAFMANTGDSPTIDPAQAGLIAQALVLRYPVNG